MPRISAAFSAEISGSDLSGRTSPVSASAVRMLLIARSRDGGSSALSIWPSAWVTNTPLSSSVDSMSLARLVLIATLDGSDLRPRWLPSVIIEINVISVGLATSGKFATFAPGAAVSLYVSHYNLCRVHEALRTAPSVALGVADRVWTVGDLLDAALAIEPNRPVRRNFCVIDGGKT